MLFVRSIAALSATLAVGFAAACGADRSVGPTYPLRLELEGDLGGIVLAPGDSAKFDPSVVDAHNNPVPGDFPVAYSVRDTSVAYVDSGNWIHAARNGETYVIGRATVYGDVLVDSLSFGVGGATAAKRSSSYLVRR